MKPTDLDSAPLRRHYWETVDPKDIVGAPPAQDGLSPGHARSKHGVSKEEQAEVLNAPERVFTGPSIHGREVDIYYRHGSVVITVAGQKTQVITAYGRVSRKGSAGDVSPERWAGDARFAEVVRAGERG